MNEREETFFNRHRDETGHTMIGQPAIFRFDIEGVRFSFTPDFYCPDCGIFFEVAGSRQAFHQDKFKLKAVKAYYPSIRLEVVTPSGEPYKTDKCGLDYENGNRTPADYRYRKDYDLRIHARERLSLFIGISNERMLFVAHALDWSPYYARDWVQAHRLPNSKTAYLIHQYLDSIEPETKTA